MSKPKSYTLDECTIDIYIQKSLKFLYPLLKIENNSKILPVNTYLSWKGEVGINEYKLVCVYKLREDSEFKQFEKNVLRRNELFEDYKEGEDNKGVYIFNLSRYKEDVFQFLKGKYSLISAATKAIILNGYSLNRFSHEYMDSFLNPEKYFEKYAQLLNVPEWRLAEVGELCNRFDRLKETLCLEIVKDTHNIDKLLLF